MSKRQIKMAIVRTALLNAATELLRSGGIPSASTRAIATAANVSTGAIFSHFDSHGALLDEAMSADAEAAQTEINRLNAEIVRVQAIMPRRKRVIG